MKPLVSIIIPCYNAEPWLKETLKSAFSQTWKNKEIILINDGSSDDSLEIAKLFESRGLIIIDQANKGASAARNKGLERASGDYIQYLDADDLLDSKKVEYQLKILQKDENKDCVASGKWGRFIKNKSDTKYDRNNLNEDMDPVEWLLMAWEEFSMMHPASWLVPRHISEESGPWNEDLTLNDDGEYFCRVVLQSKKVIYCDNALSYYRSGLGNSLSGFVKDEGLYSYYNSIELNIKNIQKYEDSPMVKSVCATSLQRFIYKSYPNVPELINKAEKRVVELGGSNLNPEGGPYFRVATSILGWKIAIKVRNLIYKIGYHKFGMQRIKNNY